MTREEDEGDRSEAFLEIKDGEIADGVVVADLDGEDEGMQSKAEPILNFAVISLELSPLHRFPASSNLLHCPSNFYSN